jgi:hypothetical protein
MKPTVLLTPRWSKPRDFMESLSLELAVAEPAMACRSTTFAGLRGHQPAEARQRVLTALAELSASHWSEAKVPHVATDEGFVSAAEGLLFRAQEQEGRIALLAEGIDRVHVDVLSALSEAWNRFSERCGGDRKVVLMMAGSLPSSRVQLEGAAVLDLPDYARAEALRVLSPHEEMGEQSEMALEFSGGVPSFVGALAEGVKKLGGLPYSATALIRLLGPVENELRQVMDLLAADPALAERMEHLACVGEDDFSSRPG